jgi:uncharacterized iron-regulated membrane protein
MKRNWRKIHGYVALAITLPLILITVSGIVLLIRDKFEYIQPSPVNIRPVSPQYAITFEELHKRFPDADQIIYRPSKGSLVVRYLDGNEHHLHPATGEILKTAMRRTNFLIELHQGSWMGKFGQHFLHVVVGLAMCFLIVSGFVIYPFKRKKVI